MMLQLLPANRKTDLTFSRLILCLGRAVKHANPFEVVLSRKQELYYDIISTYALKIGSLNSSGKLNELLKL